MNNILKKIKQILYGRKLFQVFFESLYRISLYGMNIGSGGDVSTSGEMLVLERARKYFDKDTIITIFDVGANKGEYARTIIDIFLGKSISLFVFEPSKTAFSLLKTTMALVPHNVTLINKGLGEKSEVVPLYSNSPGSKLGSIYERVVPGKAFNEKEEIFLTTIDEFCSANKISRINFIKLDIEGNELRALHGAKNMLEAGNIDIIQFEFGGANIDARTYFRDFWDLLSSNYRLFRVLKDGLQHIPKYDEKFELFSTTNYVAINKESVKNL
ncbi:MAG: FkbM family methyltransferase [bacterium]|nr:FkbM family methyltransferase [bacterium]